MAVCWKQVLFAVSNFPASSSSEHLLLEELESAHAEAYDESRCMLGDRV